MRNRLGKLTLAAAAAVCALAQAAVGAPNHVEGSRATTGSVVYVSAGNLWRAAADGSARRRLTRNGTRRDPYSPPSQADNGTIVAVRGTMLYRFARTGKAVGRPKAVASGLHNQGSLHELPFSPAISPNATKVAMTKVLLQGIYNPTTGVGGLNILAVSIEYRNTVTARKVGERHVAGDYLQSPSWIDNQRVLLFSPYNSFAPQVFVDTAGGALQPWFADQLDGDSSFDRKLVDQGELTRAGDKLAVIRGTNVEGDWRGASIQIYAVHGLGTAPAAVCAIQPLRGGPLGRPSWSPDGRMLAWSDSAGIWSSPVDVGASGCGVAPKLIVPGGASPDWGPAR
jgi:hypothetical protein